MTDGFPEITSFGTLLRYALALEEAVGDVAARAAGQDNCRPWREILIACAQQHAKRAQQLERLRRERLNEVVLQAVEGMERLDYMPDGELPTDGAEAVAQVAAAEDLVTGFYRDASARATSVLSGLERSFAKLATQSAEMSGKLRSL